MTLFAASLLAPDLGLIVWIGLTFLILLFLLRKFAWGPITSALNEREGKITESMEQAEKAFSVISAALAEAGTSLDNMLRIRVYVASRPEFDRIKPIIKAHCDAARPANTTIICELATEEMRVEFEVTARIG